MPVGSDHDDGSPPLEQRTRNRGLDYSIDLSLFHDREVIRKDTQDFSCLVRFIEKGKQLEASFVSTYGAELKDAYSVATEGNSSVQLPQFEDPQLTRALKRCLREAEVRGPNADPLDDLKSWLNKHGCREITRCLSDNLPMTRNERVALVDDMRMNRWSLNESNEFRHICERHHRWAVVRAQGLSLSWKDKGEAFGPLDKYRGGDAADVVCTAIIKAITGFANRFADGGMDSAAGFRPYLFRVISREAIRSCMPPKVKEVPIILDSLVSDEDSAEGARQNGLAAGFCGEPIDPTYDQAALEDSRRQVSECFARLSQDHQDALRESLTDDPVEVKAKRLGITAANYKGRLHRARASLRLKLEARGTS